MPICWQNAEASCHSVLKMATSMQDHVNSTIWLFKYFSFVSVSTLCLCVNSVSDVCISTASHACRRIHLNLGTKVKAKEGKERIHPSPQWSSPLPQWQVQGQVCDLRWSTQSQVQDGYLMTVEKQLCSLVAAGLHCVTVSGKPIQGQKLTHRGSRAERITEKQSQSPEQIMPRGHLLPVLFSCMSQ